MQAILTGSFQLFFVVMEIVQRIWRGYSDFHFATLAQWNGGKRYVEKNKAVIGFEYYANFATL